MDLQELQVEWELKEREEIMEHLQDQDQLDPVVVPEHPADQVDLDQEEIEEPLDVQEIQDLLDSQELLEDQAQ